MTDLNQKSGEGSTLIRAGGNVNITLAAPHADVVRLLNEERGLGLNLEKWI